MGAFLLWLVNCAEKSGKVASVQKIGCLISTTIFCAGGNMTIKAILAELKEAIEDLKADDGARRRP
ncbi:hypothetical protein KGP36_08105 [Patescibacteria group bacterium]|nr:hypothetical protein [Patescibacteria group bacterium]